jgi:hypothetical protein
VLDTVGIVGEFAAVIITEKDSGLLDHEDSNVSAEIVLPGVLFPVKDTDPPVGTEGEVEVSPIVTVELVATIVPAVDPDLKRDKKDSEPSVLVSFASVTEKDPESEVILTEPPNVTAFAGELKSELFTVPDTPSRVQ